MRRPRLGIGIGLITLAAAELALVPGVAGPAAGQPRAGLDLIAQTAFVGDTAAIIDVRVLDAPADATLHARVHEAPTSREELLSAFDGDPTTDQIAAWDITDLDEIRVGSGDVVSIRVPDEEIGELLRQPETPGPHPTVIELRQGEQVLDRITTALLVRATATTDRLGVAVLVDLAVSVRRTPAELVTVDGDDLRRALDLGSELTARVELPFTVQLGPGTIEALAAIGDAAALEGLRTATVGNDVLTGPLTALDEEAWRAAGRGDVVAEMYRLGTDTLVAAGIVPDPLVRAAPDLGPATVGEISRAVALADGVDVGTTGFILDATLTMGLPDTPLTRPVEIEDDRGQRHRAAVPDTAVADLLGAEPGGALGAQQALAELLRLSLRSPVSAGVVVDVTDVDLLTLRLFLAGLDTDSPLVPVGVSEVLSLPIARQAGRPVLVEIDSTTAPDLTAHVDRRAEVETEVEAYAALVAPNDAVIAPLVDLLRASAAADLTGQQRAAYLDEIESRVSDGMRGFEVIDRGRITLTSRRAEVPLTIVNGQAVPVTVALHLAAAKLDFPEGERREIVLTPGVNEVPIVVDTRASGDSAIAVRITTPDDVMELTSSTVRVRSTAISGLGLLISIAALAVLVSWWARSTIARRRARGRDPALLASPTNPTPAPEQTERTP